MRQLSRQVTSREVADTENCLFFFLCEQGGLAVTVISIVAMLVILYQDGVR